MLSKKVGPDNIPGVTSQLKWHSLTVFQNNSLPLDLRTALDLKDGLLTARFEVSGNEDLILLPPPSGEPQRRSHLWEHSCFEIYAALAGHKDYWEFNFSPSGDWACYYFTDYRKDRIPEEKISKVNCHSLESTSAHKTWEIHVDVASLPAFHQKQKLFLALTAVIEMKDGQKTYWALSHAGDKADFHRRDSFCIKIDG